MAARGTNRRRGRGHLSSIDMLPDEAEADIVWALNELRESRLPQTTILMEFNERLADRGFGPVSKGAWSRYAVRKAIQFRRLDEAQRLGAELTRSMEADGPDQVTIAVAEMIKVAALEILEVGELSTKGIMELSRALQSAVGAQKTSAEYREKLEREVAERMAAAAEKIGKLGKKGVSKEAIAEINRALMGGG
jgi:hypothetical protein